MTIPGLMGLPLPPLKIGLYVRVAAVRLKWPSIQGNGLVVRFHKKTCEIFALSLYTVCQLDYISMME